MNKQIINIFRPTRYKIVASIAFTFAYIVAFFVRIVFAGAFFRFSITQPSSRILLVIVNWIILAAVLYLTASFVFSKDRLSGYSLKRKDILLLVTILGLLVPRLFFEVLRFLAFFFASLTTDEGVGLLVPAVMAELLLSYVLFSLFLFFMERLKKH